ncbi:hypothetical protein QN365_18350, partial [Pseudomonas sp. RTI1]|uniref:RCC1 domain-containing protein n=3 Tax=Pseudomonas TaxID=286 RepID=UPI002B226DCF
MNTDLSVSPDSSVEPLALPNLEIPGHTGPLPDGAWGINVAAAADNFPDRGLQLYIGPWTPMSQGDNLEVLRGSDVVGSERINLDQEGQRIVMFIPTARLTNGATTLSYRVTRLGSNPETSQEVKVYVKLDRPGGHDQNGDTPGHSELQLSLPIEIVQGGVDKDTAKKGVPVTIEPYPNIAENDVIRLSWGGQFVPHTVTKDQATTPKSNPIVITVDETVILAAGDSGSDGLAVAFEVYDVVDNRSEDWSAEIRIVVDTGSSRAEAPIIKEAFNSVLDLDALGDSPVTAQVIVTGVNFAKDDQLIVNLKGTTADGTPLDIMLPSKTITSVPSVVEISGFNAEVRSLAQTQAVFTYRIIKANSSPDILSKGSFISIIGEIARLKPPVALDAMQGALDPMLPTARIEIAWDDSMEDGQTIELKWLGTRPDLSIYLPELPLHPITHNETTNKLPIVMRVQGLHLTAIKGGTLELYYLIESDGLLRESLHATLLTVGEPLAELPVPTVVGQVDGILKPADVPDGTQLIVPLYNGIHSGDQVHYEWQGSKTGPDSDWIKLSTETAKHPVPFEIGFDLIEGNDGGTVQASYWVERWNNGGTSASDALSLQIGEGQQALLQVTLEGANDGELNIDDVPTGGARAEVAAYDVMAAGDQVYFKWVDDKGSAPYENSKSVTGNMVGKPVVFTVPYATVTTSLRANVTVTCRSELIKGGELGSDPLKFSVSKGAGAKLPAPIIVEAKGTDTLNPNDALSGATVLIGAGAALQKGDTVLLDWRGQPGPGSIKLTVPVTGNGELRIPVVYATVHANDGFSIELDYTVLRAAGSTDGPSNLAEYNVLSQAGSGTLNVMGARYSRSSYRASGAARLLSAFDAKTQQPLMAQWQYQGETTETTATTLRDSQPWKPLRVSSANDSVTLNPANIIGNGIDTEIAGRAALVALRNSGDMVAWGHPDTGAKIPSTIITLSDIVEVRSTRSAYAGRRINGQVVVWGTEAEGGAMNGVSPADFVEVTSNSWAFVGIKTTGHMVAWGAAAYGGEVPAPINSYTDITRICGAGSAFAALRRSGEMVAWGNAEMGGTVPSDIAELTDIVEVMGNYGAFVALRGNGRIVAWGNATCGGTVPDEIASMTDIIELSCANTTAFAVRRATGQVVAWGFPSFGNTPPPLIAALTDIVAVASNSETFVAIRGNGHVVAWGGRAESGRDIPEDIARLDDIVQVAGSSEAFAALRKNGTVVAWGDVTLGGDTSAVSTQLTQVQALYGNTHSFVALTSDGRVVTWGHPTGG